MDLRVQRTRNNIMNAFIQLRSKKELEKITVKELAELAVINKATFYLHYRDIYDLSDTLEDELIGNCLKGLQSQNTHLIQDGVSELISAFMSQGQLFNIIFSGSRKNILVEKLEYELKKIIFERYPKYKDDLQINLFLTAQIYGMFHAYFKYKNEPDISAMLTSLSEIPKSFYSTIAEQTIV